MLLGKSPSLIDGAVPSPGATGVASLGNEGSATGSRSFDGTAAASSAGDGNIALGTDTTVGDASSSREGVLTSPSDADGVGASLGSDASTSLGGEGKAMPGASTGSASTGETTGSVTSSGMTAGAASCGNTAGISSGDDGEINALGVTKTVGIDSPVCDGTSSFTTGDGIATTTDGDGSSGLSGDTSSTTDTGSGWAETATGTPRLGDSAPEVGDLALGDDGLVGNRLPMLDGVPPSPVDGAISSKGAPGVVSLRDGRRVEGSGSFGEPSSCGETAGASPADGGNIALGTDKSVGGVSSIRDGMPVTPSPAGGAVSPLGSDGIASPPNEGDETLGAAAGSGRLAESPGSVNNSGETAAVSSGDDGVIETLGAVAEAGIDSPVLDGSLVSITTGDGTSKGETGDGSSGLSGDASSKTGAGSG